MKFRFAILTLALTALAGSISRAQERQDFSVFEVRKMLQMSSKDPIIRDFYVNAGLNQGLKPGAFITVFRKVPLADPNKGDAQSHIEIPVGVMRIIFSDKVMSIGRVHSIRPAKDSPVLEHETFMVGDRLDMGSLSFEKSAANTGEEEKTESAQKSEAPKATKDVKAEVKLELLPPPEPPVKRREASLPIETAPKGVDNQKSVEVLTK